MISASVNQINSLKLGMHRELHSIEFSDGFSQKEKLKLTS